MFVTIVDEESFVRRRVCDERRSGVIPASLWLGRPLMRRHSSAVVVETIFDEESFDRRRCFRVMLLLILPPPQAAV